MPEYIKLTKQEAFRNNEVRYWEVYPYKKDIAIYDKFRIKFAELEEKTNNIEKEMTEKNQILENALLNNYSKLVSLKTSQKELLQKYNSLEQSVSELSSISHDYPPIPEFPYTAEQLSTEFEYIDYTLDMLHNLYWNLDNNIQNLSSSLDQYKLSAVTKESYSKLLDIFDKYRELIKNKMHEYYD